MTDYKLPTPGLLNPPRVTFTPWRFSDGRPEIKGLRIYSGERYLFVRDEHLLELATTIADYISERKEQA